MFLTKASLTLFAVLFLSFGSQAQEGSSSTEQTPEDTELGKISSHWAVGVSTVNWNDSLKVTQGAQSANESANYNALMLTAQREVNIRRWGYTVGMFLGAGQANGGGVNKTLTYNQPKVNFTMAGISPRFFYRFTDKVSAGLTPMLFTRNISWPEPAGQSVDGGSNFNASLLADVNLRLFQHWDFYQGLGAMNGGSTLWKLGIAYRF